MKTWVRGRVCWIDGDGITRVRDVYVDVEWRRMMEMMGVGVEIGGETEAFLADVCFIFHPMHLV